MTAIDTNRTQRPRVALGDRAAVAVRFAAIAAIVGQAALTASAWLLPAVSQYTLLGDSISELALGRFGWVQTTAFALAGIGVVLLAGAIWRTTVGVAPRIAAVLVGLYGLGAVGAAIVPTDQIDGPGDFTSMSPGGLVHAGIAMVSFLAMLVGIGILVAAFRRDPAWRPIWAWTLGLGILALLGFLLPSFGLTQRLLVGAISAWVVVVAARMLRVARIEGSP